MSRSLRLAVVLARRSPFRIVMLTALTTVAIVIFALVSELARVSQEGLDSAIVQDSGLHGSYEVSLDSSLQASDATVDEAARHTAAGLGASVWGQWVDLPETRSECPPFEQVGEQSLRVLWRAPGIPFDLPFGDTGGIDTVWCIDGQQIPPDALYFPDADHQAVYGTRLYLRGDYQDLVLLSTTGPLRRGFIVVTGQDQDLSDEVHSLALETIAPLAASTEVDPGPRVTVQRIDQENASVRDASRGVGVTYGVIGWGVLALAGIALVAVQAIVTRQRSWFYALARSMGAGTWRIGAMLSADTLLVLLASSAASLAVLTVAQPTVRDFADRAFGVDAHVLNLDVAVTLAVGLGLIFGATVVTSLIGTVRRDPIAVLESPRD